MSGPGRRTAILDAARVLFTERGYDGTAVGDIAKSVGVSKAAITYYFPAKSEFLVTLFGPLLAELREDLDRNSAPDWPDGARRLLRDYLTTLIAFADLARWADSDPALRHDGRPGVVLRSLDQELARCIVGGSSRRGDHFRALAVVGGIWRPLHHEPVEEIAVHLDEIVDAALISYAPFTT